MLFPSCLILSAKGNNVNILGALPALLGKEGAMAVTVAVEDVISTHYNDQLRRLAQEAPELVDLRKVSFITIYPCFELLSFHIIALLY